MAAKIESGQEKRIFFQQIDSIYTSHIEIHNEDAFAKSCMIYCKEGEQRKMESTREKKMNTFSVYQNFLRFDRSIERGAGGGLELYCHFIEKTRESEKWRINLPKIEITTT